MYDNLLNIGMVSGMWIVSLDAMVVIFFFLKVKLRK